MYRIGIIGTGIIATSHAEAALEVPEAALVAAADIDESKVLQFASKYNVKPYLDYKEMINQEKPDIVIISLPHYLHKDVVLFAAEMHVHILLEKPMALNVKECETMIAASAEKHVKLFIGHIQRYIDFNIMVKEIIDTGSLGKLICINERQYTDYFSAGRPKWFLRKDMAGGGIAFNLGAHFFDRIQWVTGGKVVKVTGKVNYPKVDCDIEGTAHIFCEMNNGITAGCILNGCSLTEEQHIEYIFTGGMVEIQPFKKMVLWDKTGSHEFTIGGEDMFTCQLKNFIECIKWNTAPQISGEYGRHIIKCINAVYEFSSVVDTILIDKQ